MEKRVWDEEYGWGSVVGESEKWLFVRFDAEPWAIYYVRKVV